MLNCHSLPAAAGGLQHRAFRAAPHRSAARAAAAQRAAVDAVGAEPPRESPKGRCLPAHGAP